MKRTIVDKLIGIISPKWELDRIRQRGRTEFLLRSYDAAKTFSTDDWTSATKGGANSEIKGAQSTLRNKGRDAVRNNPYAKRGLTAIVSNTVGTGIVPHFKGKSEEQVAKIEAAWKEWAETPLCDANGKHNFYSQQAIVMSSTVESGEILSLKEINKVKVDDKEQVVHQIRLLESDFLISEKDKKADASGDMIVQGVKLDKGGRVKSYFISEGHPGEDNSSIKELEIEASRIDHVFKTERPGQVRGVSWFHPVIRQLEDFNQFQEATLISKKISACFAAFITVNDSDSTLSRADKKKKRQADSMLSPGTMKYLSPGEDIKFAAPAAATDYVQYCGQMLRAIASGLGITYTALTADYSQFTFSSAKMERDEFKKNVEMWRWSIIIPQFCDPSVKHFLNWAKLARGCNIDGVSCEWIEPAWSYIDPSKELEAKNVEIRMGLTSLPRAIKEQGIDPKQMLKETSDWNAELDKLKITLDSDPRKTTRAGIFQIESMNSNGDTNSENKNN